MRANRESWDSRVLRGETVDRIDDQPGNKAQLHHTDRGDKAVVGNDENNEDNFDMSTSTGRQRRLEELAGKRIELKWTWSW